MHIPVGTQNRQQCVHTRFLVVAQHRQQQIHICVSLGNQGEGRLFTLHANGMTKIREVSMETAVISAVLACYFQEQNPTALTDSFPLKSYLMIIKEFLCSRHISI